ncbi:MAG TPA: TonB-dependent receptor plug domain-containing protein, partial [Saprospiraceae bacterium]|nr:TonB-dependent receptor plug domain-containing protein [Saprospiraceae bacterium]
FREQDGQIILYRDAGYFAPFSISGYVEDGETGERLFAAHVYDLISGAGAVTNEYGFFSMQTRGKKAMLKASYLGCRQDTIEVDRSSAVYTQQIKLEKLVILREVVIEDEKSRYLVIAPLSEHRNTDRHLASKTYPGGEWDVQRHLEAVPGVSIGTDGIGGMHIRGGNGDQNLVLFDGVPIYHATHAIGILSVFNPLMMREVNLLKGDYPARYAGRLSSVLDVRTKEGNNKQWSLQAGIGPASANALIEGPIVKDKVGILVAARRFLPGFYLRNLSRREKERNGLTGETHYAFTDLNAKCNIALTPKDRIYLSYYHGDDRYNDLTNTRTVDAGGTVTESFERSLKWGNSVGILRWNHQFGLHVFANATFTLSRFELQSHDYVDFTQILPSDEQITGFIKRKFESNIKDAGIKFDIDHFLSNANRLRYGITYTSHAISPKSIAFDDAAQIDGFPINEEDIDALLIKLRSRAVETGVYVEEYADIGSAITISSGLHLSAFDVREKVYWSLQPRLSVRLKILENLQGHISANRMSQYMHLLTSSGIGLPTDLWVPSSATVEPQKATQVSTGLSWQVWPRLRVQSDAYYRAMQNLVAYQEGASFLFREGSVQSGILDAANWEDKVTQGSGTAYGLESLVSYSGPWCNIEIGYTYAHSTREFPELNFGDPFPFRFDRRHAVSVTGVFHFTDQFMVTAGWNYASGIPITLAESKFSHPSSSPIFPPVEVLEFSEYNAYRLPDYHRLDLGARYYWRKPKATHSLHLDIYNLYNRHNVLYIALVQDGDEFKNQKFTVLPFIPSISYQLKI